MMASAKSRTVQCNMYLPIIEYVDQFIGMFVINIKLLQTNKNLLLSKDSFHAYVNMDRCPIEGPHALLKQTCLEHRYTPGKQEIFCCRWGYIYLYCLFDDRRMP